MKIGWLRQNTLTIWPAAIGARSISTGAPAATVEASGFICAMSGTIAAAVPTAATAPDAMYRKSRRVGSAEDIVVTFAIPFLSRDPPKRTNLCAPLRRPLRPQRAPAGNGGATPSRRQPAQPRAQQGPGAAA